MTALALESQTEHVDVRDKPTVLLLDDDGNTLVALHAILDRTEADVIECEDEECVARCCGAVSTGRATTATRSTCSSAAN